MPYVPSRLICLAHGTLFLAQSVWENSSNRGLSRGGRKPAKVFSQFALGESPLAFSAIMVSHVMRLGHDGASPYRQSPGCGHHGGRAAFLCVSALAWAGSRQRKYDIPLDPFQAKAEQRRLKLHCGLAGKLASPLRVHQPWSNELGKKRLLTVKPTLAPGVTGVGNTMSTWSWGWLTCVRCRRRGI